MCNCGNKRNSIKTTAGVENNESLPPHDTIKFPDVVFVYTGKSALTATGNVTGKRYRFERPGDKQLVDYRDASSMITIPVLEKV